MSFVYGETVPVVPESVLATYPYAFIVHVVTESGEAYNAYCMKDTTYFGHVENYEYDTGLYSDAVGTIQGIDCAICNYTVGTSTEWGAPKENTAYNFIVPIGNITPNNVTATTKIVWSNFDIITAEKDSSGNYVKTGEVFFKAGSADDQENDSTDDSGDTEGSFVLPDGTEVPALPEGFFQKYPYAIIGIQASSGFTALVGSENAFAFTPQEIISSIYSSVTYDAYMAFGAGTVLVVNADGEWETTGTYGTVIYFDVSDVTILWSNHDILTLSSIDTSTGAYEIGEPMYHKSDVNYRVFGGWMNTMGNCARKIGGQSAELTPFQIQDIFKSAGASVSAGWMEGLHAVYLSQIESSGLSSLLGGMAGVVVMMQNGVSSDAVDISPAPFVFNVYTPSANFPNATNIGEFAFMSNIMLKSVTAPNLRTVGYAAFVSCSKLETLDFPLLETIEALAFSGCGNLSSFNFASIIQIGGEAFESCALTSVELPASFIGFGSTGGNAFTGCTALTTITVDEGNEYVCAVDNVLYTKDMKTLLAFPAGVTTFVTPDEVTAIGEDAFNGNAHLTKADLSENVAAIADGAFGSCSALTALILRRKSAIVTAGTNVLGTIGTNGVSWYIYVPSALVATYQADENWSAYASQFRAIEDYPDICGEADSGDTTTVEIVSWSDGTDEQIAAMVAAMDAGTLSIADTGWAVGDERQVTLSAMEATGVGETHVEQTVTLVLMDSQHYTLTETTTGGDTKDHFVVGMKNSLAEGGYMNSTATNSGSWSGSARRAWCNDVFRAAIPETLRGCFKQFKVPTATSYNGSSVTETDDYFALFAEKEIFGSVTYSNSTEAAALSQIEWYETAANRVKTKGDTGTTYMWWERSPHSSNSQLICMVLSDGGANHYTAKYDRGLAPFGCI